MTNPLLSIVSGTHQRLPYLKLLVASVRMQLPKGLHYEIVIVDGQSSDGTVAWCEAQPDIRLIRHNALLGAIKAFTDGAYAAQGEFVALLNDDVIVRPNALLKAISYLETHPSCAMVAMADNRTSKVTGNGKDYRVEAIGAYLPDGTQTMVPYGQCCVVRKELGDAADWWHANDPIIGQSRIYGGDSALSAWLWTHGWTVDAVDGCVVEDLIVRDGLRDINGQYGNQDSGNYYRRYARVELPAQRAAYPIPERLRVLHLPVYEPTYPQAANREPAWAEAFAERGALCLEVDYLNTDTDLPALVRAWQPDLILTQIQGWGEKLTPQILVDMRSAAPGAVVVNWCGDAHESCLITPPVLDLLRHVDLQTTVNAAVLPFYEREGIPAAYWQIGYKQPQGALPQMPAWDVLFQGNWYDYRAPLFRTLYALPYRVGVYGNDARSQGSTHYDFAAQAALYKNATITIGDTFPGTKAFVSNRVFQSLSQGAFLLQQYSEALEDYTGLRAGTHYVEWRTVDDLPALIAEWLSDDRAADRDRIRAAGQAYVRDHFSFAAQVDKLLTELLPELEYAPRRPAHDRVTPVGVSLAWEDGIPR